MHAPSRVARRPLIRALCIFLGISQFAIPSWAQLPATTAIDEYVNEVDDSYRWKIVATKETEFGSLITVDMVSQNWLTSEEVNRTEWQHWLQIAIPKKPASDIGMLMIGGGKNDGRLPGEPSPELQKIAMATNTVVAELKMVPNQPLVFHSDGVERKEDDLIGYTWDQYLQSGEARWLARNAMVKSAVRAMDTLTAVTSQVREGHKLTKFVVAGASKRGWTTWLTGAIDPRVVAIVPIVIDVLNTDASMKHHFAAYGYWAPAIGNYVQHQIMERLDHPRLQQLYQLVDPYYYRHRLTMPKLILNAAGDQFFLPDSSRFYWDELQGEKLLRYVPNTDHSMRDSDAFQTLAAFYARIVSGAELPEVTWSNRQGSLVAKSSIPADEVRVWTADNPEARDFRLETLGKKYTSVALEALNSGEYQVPLANPKQGWRAHFIEFTFDSAGAFPLKLTTGVVITPYSLPYKSKSPSESPSVTIKARFEQETLAARVLEVAEAIFPKEVSDASLKTKRIGDTVYLNWASENSRPEAEKVLGWLRQQKAVQLNVQLESGSDITTLPELMEAETEDAAKPASP
ncbi:MAG: PhoPQ-activated pathogenicity-related family protein [Pirellulaceae bacterium]